MSAGGERPDASEHPRFFVGCDDAEGEELLEPGRVLGYDCLYENVEEEEEDEDDDEMYDSVSRDSHCSSVYAVSQKTIKQCLISDSPIPPLHCRY